MTHTYAAKNKALLLLVLVLSLTYYIQLQSDLCFLQQKHESLGLVSRMDDALQDSNLWLRPGDLPGYTGWARPFDTLAGSFRPPVRNAPAPTARNVTVRIECVASSHCGSGGSLFYVRAFGPSVLPGSVTDHSNGNL
jgi:hypothetical protein